MTRKDLKKINKNYLSHKEPNPLKNTVKLQDVEDNDIAKLELYASQATRKGYVESKKYSKEVGVVILSNNKLIKKVQGKPNKIISVVNQRKVEVGNKARLG